MKSIRFGLKKYRIKTSWKEVTIKELHLLNSIYNVKLDIGMSLLEKGMYQLSILSDMTLEECRKFKFDQLEKALTYLKFAQELPKVEHISKFKFEGKSYVIEDPFKNDMLGKYIVSEHLLLKNQEIIDSVNNGEFSKFPYIIATVVHEKGQMYTDLDIPDRTELFQDLDCITALGVVQFFFVKLKQLESTTRAYLSKVQMQRNMNKHSQKNTVGMHS